MTDRVKGPWLQWPTCDCVLVMWETADECAGEVEWFETQTIHAGLSGHARTLEETRRAARESTSRRIHQVPVEGLKPGEDYYYRIVGEQALHPLRCAPARDTPFSFCVTSETGGYGDDEINRRIFQQMSLYRPDFLLIVGDAVSRGTNYDDWDRYFFGPGQDLLPSTPFYLCPGNHEENADWFYQFTAFPPPGNYFGFDYGNAHFTALDSTRLVDYIDGEPQATAQMAGESAQRLFLRQDLKASAAATWRIVFYHYPPYVSGDYEVAQMRQLGPDLEAGGVDLVFNSHTIVYERSHPIRDGQLNVENGIPYIVAGGAGAAPEWFHPKRAWHTAQSHAVPHFLHVSLAATTLELQAVDMDGRVFDRMCLQKSTIWRPHG